ncbi:MAG: NAD(P)H-dependent oxidoreductase [Serpentinimonas sp.]|jgi:putative NADPH-quinone reductase|nr:NAD(P)H-dependent oxidoreductase [Serpentinimonas sp.]
MQCLVVHAHPNPESLSAALFATAQDTLRAAGHEVSTIDLYAEGFDPVLSREERAAYLECPDWLVQRFAAHIELLQRCEHLVLVYPTWWWGPPAMLKGWLERVWLPKITFEPALKKGDRLRPKMQHIRRFTVVTHGGSPWWWLQLMGDPHKKLMLRGMAMLFAPRCRKTWLQLHNMNNVTPVDCQRFIERVRQALSRP